MTRPIVLTCFIVLLPTLVQAQGRGMRVAAPHPIVAARPMAAAPRVVAHPAQPIVRHVLPGTRIVARTGAPRTRTPVIRSRIKGRPIGNRRRFDFDRDFDDRRHRRFCSSVPGLGFDFPHLAAVCGPGAVGNLFPFFPFFDGGFSLSNAPAAAEERVAVQSQETDSTASEAKRSFRAIQAAPASVAETPQPSPGATEQYVFVRRDGTLFFAVAYAWEDGNLRYVTNEGLRRSVARETLDLPATQQFNEQRGLVFRLPA